MEEREYYTIPQASAKLGVKTQQLRYLCRSGMIPYLKHTLRRKVKLQEWQLNWARTVLGLRACGFTKTEIRKYISLCCKGAATRGERKALINTKKRQLWQDLDDLRANIDFAERQEDLLESSDQEDVLGDWI